MTKTWVYSDPHFYHKNIVKFTNYDGSPVRPWDDADKMTEEMIEWYNDLVSPEDRVYILGDVAFSPRALRASAGRLGGRKVLVKGNHDRCKPGLYAEYFDDVRSYVMKKGFIMSHIPIHPACMGRWEINIHGHLHNNDVDVTLEYGDHLAEADPRYVNVCVEKTNYRPKLLDEVLHEAGVK